MIQTIKFVQSARQILSSTKSLTYVIALKDLNIVRRKINLKEVLFYNNQKMFVDYISYVSFVIKNQDALNARRIQYLTTN